MDTLANLPRGSLLWKVLKFMQGASPGRCGCPVALEPEGGKIRSRFADSGFCAQLCGGDNEITIVLELRIPLKATFCPKRKKFKKPTNNQREIKGRKLDKQQTAP